MLLLKAKINNIQSKLNKYKLNTNNCTLVGLTDKFDKVKASSGLKECWWMKAGWMKPEAK